MTRHPPAEWTAQQIVEAFPCGTEPRFLHRDRDAIDGPALREKLKALGITEVVRSRKSLLAESTVVAVARRLATLLHRLWITRAEYQPLRKEAERVAG